MSSLNKKFAIGLAAVGPGLFLIGYNIGTGSVTTMAQTGANHGMSLFWALILSCIFTYILMVTYGRMALVTGKTALQAVKTEFKFGWILALYILIAIVIGELLAIIGVMGIVADLVQEGLRMATGSTFSRGGIIFVLSCAMYYLIWKGKYKQFEKVLTVFVILMAFSFFVVFILLKPDLKEIFSGMIPNLDFQPGSFGLIAAIAGTTCSAAVFIVRSTVVLEKGWTKNDIPLEKKDSFVSASMMLFLSAMIMAVAAGTLHPKGISISNTIDMVHLFEPLGGKVAAFVFIIGVASAGLSTIFPIVLIAPWLISDYTGKPRDLKSPLFRILILIGFLFAFGSVFLTQRPPALMIFSQAFQACILPAVAIPAAIMISNRSKMKEYAASMKLKIGLWAVILFSFVTTWFAIVELLKL
ncbi:MAG TPA: Nramp family divalent metal transporter [Saprospiraceae bacterium]|nr:Nramp family divalent metal transporter [Saprospiraceae bacterium]HOY12249.1 Nramp family divalent metal transporter [Saprospiraceae bacterium]HPN67874.1 Nramp family divalent metal transporter [Saprospiraceae bacterium]